LLIGFIKFQNQVAFVLKTGSGSKADIARLQHAARLAAEDAGAPHDTVAVTMELVEANAGLSAAVLPEPGASWTNAVLWDGGPPPPPVDFKDPFEIPVEFQGLYLNPL
jgi:hypothetical protein